MAKSKLSDKQLIDQYLHGDKYSLAALVGRWHKVFCEKAYWIVRDREMAKDIAQDCWVIITSRLDSLQDRDKFKSWALRIVYSKAIDEYKRSAMQDSQQQHLQLSPANTSESTDKTALQAMLSKAIEHLPAEKQQVIKLFYLQGYTVREISRYLDIPAGTVKSRLFTAREELKLKIKSYEKGK